MKIKPPGQGVGLSPEMPVQDNRCTPSSDPAGPASPPAAHARLSSPAHVRLVPPGSAVAVTRVLPVVLGRLQSSRISSVEFLGSLRRATFSPEPGATRLKTLVESLDGIQGSTRWERVTAWMRVGEWDSREALPGTMALSWMNERLGNPREPLAEILTRRLEAAGVEELEAADRGWQMAGIFHAVQLVWNLTGMLPREVGDVGDPLVDVSRRQLEVSERILADARRILQRYLPSSPPTGPLRI